MKNKVYTFNQHLHNYALWAASRSVQRGFVSTLKISNAIEKSGLREFVESYNGVGKEEFKVFHSKCAVKIMNALKENYCTYGIAAKIIAIYLKTTLIIYNKGQNCDNIHPPLDKILLTNFLKCNKIKEYTYKPWTKLNYKEYWKLTALIEKYNGKVNWRLEQYWKLFN